MLIFLSFLFFCFGLILIGLWLNEADETESWKYSTGVWVSFTTSLGFLCVVLGLEIVKLKALVP